MCGAGLAFKNPKNMCGWEIKGELLKKMIGGHKAHFCFVIYIFGFL